MRTTVHRKACISKGSPCRQRNELVSTFLSRVPIQWWYSSSHSLQWLFTATTIQTMPPELWYLLSLPQSAFSSVGVGGLSFVPSLPLSLLSMWVTVWCSCMPLGLYTHMYHADTVGTTCVYNAVAWCGHCSHNTPCYLVIYSMDQLQVRRLTCSPCVRGSFDLRSLMCI